MNATRPATVPRLSGEVFAVWCEDGPGAGALRRSHLDGHLAHVERHHDRYLVAGPLRRDGAAALVGSLFVVTARNEDEARSFLQEDPYFQCGLFARIDVRTLTPAAGRWIGGVIWDSPDALRAVADGGAAAGATS